MMNRPTRDYSIRSRQAIRALTAATRQEIVDALAGAGALTVARLAALLGRRPDALYFHIRVLLRAGLLVERLPGAAANGAATRKNGRTAAVYDLPARPVRLDYESAPRPDLARVVRLALRLAQREFERECLSGRPAGAGPT